MKYQNRKQPKDALDKIGSRRLRGWRLVVGRSLRNLRFLWGRHRLIIKHFWSRWAPRTTRLLETWTIFLRWSIRRQQAKCKTISLYSTRSRFWKCKKSTIRLVIVISTQLVTSPHLHHFSSAQSLYKKTSTSDAPPPNSNTEILVSRGSSSVS